MNIAEMEAISKNPFVVPNMAKLIEGRIGKLILDNVIKGRTPTTPRLVLTTDAVAARRQKMFDFIKANGPSPASVVSETIGGHPSNVHTDLVFMFTDGRLCRERAVSKHNRTCHIYWVNPDWVNPEDLTLPE
jgi:hypothetical protein